jgi:hypothetical protein
LWYFNAIIYTYKPHQSIADETPAFILDAPALVVSMMQMKSWLIKNILVR